MHARFIFTVFALALNMAVATGIEAATPNIVFVLADDMGYGDVQALNPDSKIATPNLDRMALQGMAFTDAHSSSSVCTPTRYGVLTGRYNWRSRLKRGVLNGFSSHLISPDRMTVAGLLKKQGYHTACIGKWHLGMDWSKDEKGKVDYTKPIAHGPNGLGFDYFFGISASLDMPPYIWIHNDRTVGVPTTTKAFHRKGPAHADFEAIDVLPTITQKTVEYIGQRAATKTPFFLYFPLNAPHTPILPTKEFQGRSGVGKYGDFVMQVDDTVGQVLGAIDKAGIAENTLVIFTADNGCSPAANIKNLMEQGHAPNHHFRGHKADIYEGGHRVPFLARWPAVVKPGSTCDQTICLVDLTATVAGITGTDLDDGVAEDSVSFLPALKNPVLATPLREATVHHSINGSFAIRRGKWKLEFCPGSGGWSDPRPGKAPEGAPPIQLYDLSADVSEQNNVQDRYPEVVNELTALLKNYIERGRSTPGRTQANEGEVNFRKPPEQRKRENK